MVIVSSEMSQTQKKYAELCSEYYSCQSSLTNFLKFAKSALQTEKEEHEIPFPVVAFGHSTNKDDVWCIDTRGVLTITVEKQSYERLGIVGSTLPWKGCEDIHVIRLALLPSSNRNSEPQTQLIQFYGNKQNAALETFESKGELWNITYYNNSTRVLPNSSDANILTEVHKIIPQIRYVSDAKVPNTPLRPRPKVQDTESEEVADWEEESTLLFEWVGLACLGSQRLKANDNPDPYLAVYSPGFPVDTKSIVHIRWSGLVPLSLIEKVLDIARETSFASVVGQSILQSPVTYVPVSASSHPPLRSPRPESEDTWCLILQNSGDNSSGGRWLLSEVVGQWDSRWG